MVNVRHPREKGNHMNSAIGINRREFVKGAACAGAAASSLALVSNAVADEQAGSFAYADTIAWNAEYDVVVVAWWLTPHSSAAQPSGTLCLIRRMKRAHVGSPALEPSKTVPVREVNPAPRERHLHLRRPDGSRPVDVH